MSSMSGFPPRCAFALQGKVSIVLCSESGSRNVPITCTMLFQMLLKMVIYTFEIDFIRGMSVVWTVKANLEIRSNTSLGSSAGRWRDPLRSERSRFILDIWYSILQTSTTINSERHFKAFQDDIDKITSSVLYTGSVRGIEVGTGTPSSSIASPGANFRDGMLGMPAASREGSTRTMILFTCEAVPSLLI